MEDLDAMLNEIDFGEEPEKEVAEETKKEVIEEPVEEINLEDFIDEDEFEEEKNEFEEEKEESEEVDDLFADDLVFDMDEPDGKEEESDNKEEEVKPEESAKEEIAKPKKPTKEVMENSPTALESYEGKEWHISKFNVADPVSASVNIIRLDGTSPMLIAMGPTKVISCTDEEARILLLDHILKTQEISEDDRKKMLRYELSKKETVKKIFGTDDIAKINNMSKKEFDTLLENSPERPQSLVEKLSEELGIEISVTPEIAEAKDEAELLKILLKEKAK